MLDDLVAEEYYTEDEVNDILVWVIGDYSDEVDIVYCSGCLNRHDPDYCPHRT